MRQSTPSSASLASLAASDFRSARNRAALKELLARITGKNIDLLSFDEIRLKLKAQSGSERGLVDIPVAAIIGSVGRYTDFTRDFLPRRDANEQRWVAVKVATNDLAGLPPIEAYQIGEAYFVKDGNHRVSHIQGYVTEVKSRVPLTPDTTADDLILIVEYAQFLEKTQLDELRPGANLKVTVPGQYNLLKEHIEVHRYFMSLNSQSEIPYREAVAHWYDTIYLPVLGIISEKGIMRSFPDRTETDLYLWITEHRTALVEELGWEVSFKTAAVDFAQQEMEIKTPAVSSLENRLMDVTTPMRLEKEPPGSEWQSGLLTDRQEQVFVEILVPINGLPSGWNAVHQALVIAQRESGRLHGLHILSPNDQQDELVLQPIQDEFQRLCRETNVQGDLTITRGEIATQICRFSRWVDLIVLNLMYPPAPQPLARLSSGFSKIVARCARPVLATPQTSTPMEHPLLAFDGSVKSEQALYVAAYMAKAWKLPLTVTTILERNRTSRETLDKAQRYLEEHEVQANYLATEGPVAQTLLRICEDQQCDTMIMGGYGYSPALEVLLGSTVDYLVWQSEKPVIICR
jgi:nucleotide-binding universal stress UspA family protein